MPRSTRWTDDELRAAVAASTSLRQVCLKLGLVPGKYETLRRHIARLNRKQRSYAASATKPTAATTG